MPNRKPASRVHLAKQMMGEATSSYDVETLVYLVNRSAFHQPLVMTDMTGSNIDDGIDGSTVDIWAAFWPGEALLISPFAFRRLMQRLGPGRHVFALRSTDERTRNLLSHARKGINLGASESWPELSLQAKVKWPYESILGRSVHLFKWCSMI